MTALVTKNLALLAEAPGGVTTLRALLLELAVTGRLSAAGPAWRATNLRELVVSSGAGWSPSCETRPRSGDEWGILKVSAVSWSQFRPDENKALPAHLAPRPELEVLTGDFLVSRANTAELVARSVVVEHTPPKLMLSDKIVRLRLSAACAPRFVQLANSAPAARSYYARVAGGTSSSMKNVSREQILALPVLLPPLAEQHRIVAKVDELMALCDRLEARQQDAEAAHAQLVQALLDSLTQARDADEFQACWQRLARQFESLLITDASVAKLGAVVLHLAVSGRLVPQQEGDGLAEDLLLATAALRRKPLAGRLAHTGLRAIAVRAALPEGWVSTTVGAVLICRDGERVPVSQNDREGRAKLYDYYGASGVIDKIDGFLFEKPLLLVGEDGANLINRSTPIAFIARGKYWVNNHAHVLDGVDEDLLGYMALFFNAIDLKPYVTGTAQPKLNQAKLNAIPVLLPPPGEQRRIVAKVTELLALCDQLKARIAAARAKHAQLAEALVAQAVA